MDDPLAIYLHDHLAGSKFAVELLENLQQRHSGDETGAFAAAILSEIQQDRRVLEDIVERVGRSHFDAKDALAWLAEKTSRVKLSHGHPDLLSTFEALETLALGIMGKLLLWRALSLLANCDDRLAGLDFSALAVGAQDQFERVEKHRLSHAVRTFERANQTERAVPS